MSSTQLVTLLTELPYAEEPLLHVSLLRVQPTGQCCDLSKTIALQEENIV
jgi:hypothetical protein